MFLKYSLAVLKYLAGVLAWLVLFGALKIYGIFNLYYAIDGLWTHKISEDLVKNLLGEYAFHVYGTGYDDKYIYGVEYYQNGTFRIVSLSSLLDPKSFKQVERRSTTITYTDKKYKYVLHHISDGVFLRAHDK